jgi:hypothetical protein
MSQTKSNPKTASSLPPRPRLVLRAGFAGRKDLTSDETTRLQTALAAVLHTLGYRLAAIASGVPVEAGKEPRVSAFFQEKAPLLRLVTGLCEGADAVAAQVLERVSIQPDAGAACVYKGTGLLLGNLKGQVCCWGTAREDSKERP